MTSTTFLTEAELDAAAAHRVITVLKAAIQRKGYATFIGSAGRTPTGAYRELVRRREDLDWSRVRVVQMDEYLGLPVSDPRSQAHYLLQELVVPLAINDFRSINDGGGSLARPWPVHDALGWSADLVLHGIGRNGHIGFNEPGTAPHSESGEVQLAATTVQDNAVGLDRGLTIGLACLLSARHSLVLAKGPAKAQAIHRAAFGPVSPACPASLLRSNGSRVQYFLDAEAELEPTVASYTGQPTQERVIDLRELTPVR